MFPFQQGELSFQNGDGDQEEINFEDLILLENNNNYMNDVSTFVGVGDVNLLGGNNNKSSSSSNSNKRGRGRGQRSSSSNIHNDSEKKVIHRDIERQRRQEMSGLYSSLRNILPAQYIKGKRSISEHVEEAANYIRDLERNVKELEEKRDELRKSSVEAGSSSNSSSLAENAVNIRQIEGALEIEINVDCEHQGFSLSVALQIVYEEGLNVESYSSTKVDGLFVHHLLCEVTNERACIDLNQLQQRLINLVS